MANLDDIFQRPNPADPNANQPQVSQGRSGGHAGDVYARFASHPLNARVVGIVQKLQVDLDRLDGTASANFDVAQAAHQAVAVAVANRRVAFAFYLEQGLPVPQDVQEKHDALVRLAEQRDKMTTSSSGRSIRERNATRLNLAAGLSLINANGGEPFVDRIVAAMEGDAGEAVRILRAKERALRQKQRDIKAAPVGLADAKKAVRRQLDELKAMLPWVQVDKTGVVLNWPTTTVKAQPSHGFEYPQVPDVRGLAVLANEEALLAYLDVELEKTYSRITIVARPADKPKLVADIDAEILELQRVEVATILAAQARGVDIEMSTVDPRALLGVDGPAVKYSRDLTFEDMNVGPDADR